MGEKSINNIVVQKLIIHSPRNDETIHKFPKLTFL